MTSVDSEESKISGIENGVAMGNDDVPVKQQVIQSGAGGVYNLDDAEWTQDIIDVYSPQSFVKEYSTLKKLLETFDLDPVQNTLAINAMVNKYQENPELLDPHLQEMVNLIMKCMKPYLSSRDESVINDPKSVINCGFEVVYTLSIVRGYKTVVRYLPHEVVDLEPTLHYLLAIDQQQVSLWYARYVLCIWLSIIVRVPFNLNSIDSYGDMVDNILHIGKTYLARSEKSREGAAVLVSRLFSRPDFEQTHMAQFFDWCLLQLEKLREEQNIFLFTGIFRTLAEIFKHAHRDALLVNAPSVLERSGKLWSTNKSRVVRKYATKLMQRIGLVFLKPVVASWRYQKGRHVLLQSAGTSTSQAASPSKPAASLTQHDNDQKSESTDADNFAVPTQIEYILDILLNCLRDKETVVRWSAAKGIGRITMRLPRTLGDEVVTNVMELLSPTENHQAWHGGCLCLAELSRRGLLLPSRIPDVIERISKAMLYDVFQGQSSVGDQVRDAACYVAWAFARAYEPSLMQPYVSTLAKSLLTMAVFDKEIHCRRAACAAFQENVGRQGNFAHGIEITTTADYWTVGLLSNAYLKVSRSIAQFAEYQRHLIEHLVHHKLTYWELRIRHLAAHALYQLADLDPSFVAEQVLPILINRCQSQSVYERHGGLCAIAYIVRRLHELGVACSDELQKHIKNIVPKLEKNRGYRGRGGERVREECCNLIAAFCTAQFTISDKGMDRFQQSIDENLRIPQQFVQDAALRALQALSRNYYDGMLVAADDTEEAGQQQQLLLQRRCQQITLKWCGELRTEIVASVTRGYSRGLGVLSRTLIRPHLKLVVDTLIRKSLITAKEDTRDYETRKFCCIALADLVENIGVSDAYAYTWSADEDAAERKNDDDEDEADELRALGIDLDVTKEKHERNPHHAAIVDEEFAFVLAIGGDDDSDGSLLYDRIVNALLLRFEDYEVDRRGDVGSFVREHALLQMYRVLVMLAKANQASGNAKWLRPGLATLVLNLVLRQLAEKLDRVRRAAGHVIALLFDSDDETVQNIRFEHDAQIRAIFAGHSTVDGGVDWSNPSLVFPLLVRALDLAAYRRCVMEGLVQSIGCINSTMSKLALDALDPYLNALIDAKNNHNGHEQRSNLQQLVAISDDLLYCVQKRQFNQLFMVPFLKAIGILLADKAYFEPLQDDDKFGAAFASNLMAQLKKECFKSRDILKLMTSIKVFVGLVLFPVTRESALQRLMVFLGYQYPALRKQTCLELSSAIAAHGERIIKEEKLQNLAFDYLSGNVWGGTDLDKIREQRNELFTMFEIKPPKLKSIKRKCDK